MDEDKFRQWFEAVKKGAKVLLKKDGEHAPIVLVIEGNGKLRALLMDFENNFEKHMAYEIFLPTVIQETKATGFIAINESWYVAPKELKGKTMEDLDNIKWGKDIPMPSQHPDRKEAVMISGFLKGGLKLSTMIPFHHKRKRIIIDKEDERLQGHADSGDMHFGLYETAIEAIEKPKADDTLVGYR